MPSLHCLGTVFQLTVWATGHTKCLEDARGGSASKSYTSTGGHDESKSNFLYPLVHLLLLRRAGDLEAQDKTVGPGGGSDDTLPVSLVGWWVLVVVQMSLRAEFKAPPLLFLLPPEWLVFIFTELLSVWYPWWRDGSQPHWGSVFWKLALLHMQLCAFHFQKHFSMTGTCEIHDAHCLWS